eukprot:6206460-Pleurochrysis_carterae.AAC.1
MEQRRHQKTGELERAQCSKEQTGQRLGKTTNGLEQSQLHDKVRRLGPAERQRRGQARAQARARSWRLCSAASSEW